MEFLTENLDGKMDLLSALDSEWRHDADLHETVTKQGRLLHDHQQELVRLDSNAVFDYPPEGRKGSERLMYLTEDFSIATEYVLCFCIIAAVSMEWTIVCHIRMGGFHVTLTTTMTVWVSLTCLQTWKISFISIHISSLQKGKEDWICASTVENLVKVWRDALIFAFLRNIITR